MALVFLVLPLAFRTTSAHAQANLADEPPFAHEAFIASLDDPRSGLTRLQPLLDEAVATNDAHRSFWLHLAVSLLHAAREDSGASREHVDRARAVLDSQPLADARQRLWLQSRELAVAVYWAPVAEQRRLADAFEAAVTAAGDQPLRCRTTYLRAFILHAADANAEAWETAGQAEECASRFADPRYRVWGLYWRATLATRVRSETPASVYVDQALQILAHTPARQLRALMLRVAAEVAVNNGQADVALQRFRESLVLFKQLGAPSGAGQALIEIARLHLGSRHDRDAMAAATEAVSLLQPPIPVYRLAIAQALLVESMTRLRHPHLSAEAERLGRTDMAALTLRERARVLESLASGQAATGQHAAAYQSLRQLLEVRRQIDDRARTVQLRELAVQYETASKEAENRELRYRSEAEQLKLAAGAERQRALSLALVAAVLLLVAAAGFGLQLVRSRRRIAELATRDALTKSPNRGAIVDFAQQQLALCRRLGVPLTLALIDLDHFKRVNDTHGHGAGDAVLQALARTAKSVLRGHDLLGRYGGEEWLLVAPGARIDQMPAVFERLRNAFAQAIIDGMPSPHSVTFSMGAAMREEALPEETLVKLIERADKALYAAKAAGRNTLRCAVSPPSG